MRYRAAMIGLLALTLLASAPQLAPSYCRIATSARSFHDYFRTLEGSRTGLNPVERFVFSLMLTNTQSPPEARSAAQDRTS